MAEIKKIPINAHNIRFLQQDSTGTISTHMTRAAEVDKAPRIGRLDLYEEPNEVIEHYKEAGFDIVDEMEKVQGNCLWVRARAIDADVANENGDYFSWEELTKEREIQSDRHKRKMPAYKSFEGVPIYANHENNDITKAKGKVVFAELDEEERCVYCTFYVDADAYPDIAKSIQLGTITDVSMGCQVEFSYCSICGNRAEKESEWCEHLKSRKGKKFSGVVDKGKRKGQKIQNELVYEDNHDLKFIELSIVSDGAFASCMIDAILPHEDVLNNANKLRRTASYMKQIIHQNLEGIMKKQATVSNLELSEYLDSSQDILGKIEDFSLAIINDIAMTKSASMNKEAYMNVLDTLNDVLNKIEAVIVSLLSRKDNIDLSHVAKISKAMSDLQQVISDLIDDGVGTLSDAVNIQQAAPQPGQEQQVAAQDYTAGGNNVGRVMGMEQAGQQQGNMQTQPVANMISDEMSAVPYQFTLEPAGFQQAANNMNDKWLKFSQDLQNNNQKMASVVEELNVKPINLNPENKKGGQIMSSLNERVANALTNKVATIVEQPIIASRNDGKYKVVISDKVGEEITGYYDDQKTDWQPSSLTVDDVNEVRENRVANVTQKLMDDFVGFVKEASWNPVTPKNVQEEQVGAKREGHPEDVQEVQISEKRKGNPDDVQEEQISEKRTGPAEEKSELRLQEDSAKVWGRKDNPTEVQEEQLGEVRKDVDNRVWEHKLDSRRSNTSESKVATASLNAIACAVCDSGASPSEVLEVAKELSEDEEILSKVAYYFADDAYKTRIAKRERVDLGLDEAEQKDITSSFLERIADVLVEDEGVTVADIKSTLASVATAPKDGMKQLIGKLAREQASNIRLASGNDKSREDLIKGAVFAAMSDAYDEPLTRSHLKVALLAVAETAAETEATPNEIFDIINSIEDDSDVLAELETERLPNAMASRMRDKERKEFWGKTASKEDADIRKVLFASLADYAAAMEDSEDKTLPSHLIWQVTKKLASGGENAKILVDAAIQARTDNVKDAASLTDRTDTVREIRLSMDEIPNTDPSSENFAETVRDYVIAFLQNQNYRVDPETFNFTKLTVNDNTREVVAVVQSSIVKEFSDQEFTVEENEFDMTEPLLTPMALKQRKNKREALIKEAQAAPMGGAAPPAGAEAPAAPPAGGEGPGLSSLLGGGADAGPGEMEEEPNLDGTAMPGQIKPIGSICPACGSTNVDLAASQGECQDCHTKFKLSISIGDIVTPDEQEGLPEEGGEEELGEGLEGLGAELAPPGPEGAEGAPAGGAAAPAAAPPAGGGMPMAASVSWQGTTAQFVKLAKNATMGLTDEQVEGPKPPGTVCLACGNKNVRRAKSQYFCDACETIGKIDIKDVEGSLDKLEFTVSYLLPVVEE